MDMHDRGATIDVIRKQLEEQRHLLQAQQDECIKLAAKLEQRKKKLKAWAMEQDANASARQSELDNREEELNEREKLLDRYANKLDTSHASLAVIHDELQRRLHAAREKAREIGIRQDELNKQEGEEREEEQQAREYDNPSAAEDAPPVMQDDDMHVEQDVKREDERSSSSSEDDMPSFKSGEDPLRTGPQRDEPAAKRQKAYSASRPENFPAPPASHSIHSAPSHPPPMRKFIPKLPNKPQLSSKQPALDRREDRDDCTGGVKKGGLESLPRERMVEALSRTRNMNDNQAQPSITHARRYTSATSASQGRMVGPGRQEGSSLKEVGERKYFQLGHRKKRRDCEVTAEDIRDDQLLKNTIDLMRRSTT